MSVVRNIYGEFIYCSDAYREFFRGTGELLNKPIAALALDEVSLANIHFKDNLVLANNQPLQHLEWFVVRDELYLLEVQRTPLLSMHNALAISLRVVDDYQLLQEASLDNGKAHDLLLQRIKIHRHDLLIGLSLMEKTPLVDIAHQLNVSQQRMKYLIKRFCASFGIYTASSKRYLELFIQHGIYKLIDYKTWQQSQQLKLN